MVEIVAAFASRVQSGNVNPRLSPALQGFQVGYWPASDAIIRNTLHSVLVTNFPVGSFPRSVAGRIATVFSDDFYHRIHVRPRSIALGNVVSAQVTSVEIWNAYLVPQTLLSIDGLQEGMTLDGPDTFPLIFGGLQAIEWDVSVTRDGPSTIDVTLIWNFNGIPDGEVDITGARVVAWTFAPDWSDGVEERLAWATDVLASETAMEQRRSLRASPRRRFDVTLLLEGRERAMYENMVIGWGSRVWALPVWPDVQRTAAPVLVGALTIPCTTTGRDFRAGGLAILRGGSTFPSEAVEILSLTPTALTLVRPTQLAWSVGSRLYPGRTARFRDQPTEPKLTDRAAEIRVSFQTVEPSDWPAATLPLYRGFPVYDVRSDESEQLEYEFERLARTLDNMTGIPHVLDPPGTGFAVIPHRRVLQGVTERSAYRSLLYWLRGQQRSVWVPTHNEDMVLTATVPAASLTLPIQNVGHARFALNHPGRRNIQIRLRNGTVFNRLITGAAEADANNESVTIDTALGVTVAPADVARISYLTLCRSLEDEIAIRHITDVEGVATSSLRFRAVRDDDP